MSPPLQAGIRTSHARRGAGGRLRIRCWSAPRWPMVAKQRERYERARRRRPSGSGQRHRADPGGAPWGRAGRGPRRRGARRRRGRHGGARPAGRRERPQGRRRAGGRASGRGRGRRRHGLRRDAADRACPFGGRRRVPAGRSGGRRHGGASRRRTGVVGSGAARAPPHAVRPRAGQGVGRRGPVDRRRRGCRRGCAALGHRADQRRADRLRRRGGLPRTGQAGGRPRGHRPHGRRHRRGEVDRRRRPRAASVAASALTTIADVDEPDTVRAALEAALDGPGRA